MPVVFPPIRPGDAVRISASTYMAWKRCPASAEARLQGVFAPDTRVAFAGSLAHLVFSRHLRHGPIPEDDFVQVCREEIGNSTLNNKLSGLELGRLSVLEPLIEEVRALYDRFVRFPSDGFAGAEVDLGHELPDAAVSLVGKVDAVFEEGAGGHRLVDWKTGDLGETEEQLGFYAMLWALTRDELPLRVEAVSVRTGDVYRAEPGWDDVGQVASEVAGMVSELRTAWESGGGAVTVAGPWCRWCPILASCPDGQAAEALL